APRGGDRRNGGRRLRESRQADARAARELRGVSRGLPTSARRAVLAERGGDRLGGEPVGRATQHARRADLRPPTAELRAAGGAASRPPRASSGVTRDLGSALVKVGVVGLGTMGAGIAQLAVEAGLETVGREVTDELGETARGRIEHFLSRKVEKGQISGYDIGLLRTTTEVGDMADCDVVIEAIVEELAPKQELFAALEQVCRADAVLATNTSALSVTEIAGAVSTPERVVGMPFFNPA